MALARLLHRDGWLVTVVERAPTVRAGGYAVDLRGAGLAVAADLGVLDELRAGQTRMTGTTVLDAAGEAVGALPAEEFAGELEVPKTVLTQLLFERTRADVDYLFDDTIVSIEPGDDGVTATLQHAGARSVDLVVGADGLWSRTRRLAITDDPGIVHHLGLSGAGFTTDNLMGLDRHGVLRATPGTAVYAVSAGDRTRLTVSLTIATGSPALDRASRGEQEDAIRTAFAGDGWRVPALLDRMTRADDFYFASACQVRLPAWSSGRVVLLGDAACCAAPTSGMGTTQAFVAADALAGELRGVDGRGTTALLEALHAYEDRIRPVSEHNQALGVEGAARFGAGPAAEPPVHRSTGETTCD